MTPGSRRSVALATAAAMSIAALALAGCGSDDAATTSVATVATVPTTTAPAATATATTPPTTGGVPSVSVTGPGFDGTFTVTSCTNAGESDLQLSGRREGGEMITLAVPDGGTGTIEIDGGDEQDSVTLEGKVTSLSVGDAGDIQAKGDFSQESLGSADTGFTITGSCAGA